MSDPCCPRCRGALAICVDKVCSHHVERQMFEARDDRSMRLYPDHTANAAIARIEGKRRRRR